LVVIDTAPMGVVSDAFPLLRKVGAGSGSGSGSGKQA
jgi:hypothetical protein